jgi:phosphohistidine phosphatase
MTELLLLRHGKSDWSAGTDDYHRPLKNRGKRGAQRIGTWLWQQDLVPDHIVSSPATRARETAFKAAKSMGLGVARVHLDKRVYLPTTDDLLAVLHDCPPGAQRILLVGHNPSLEDLLTRLVHDAIAIPEDGKLLPTATLARLDLDCSIDRASVNCARLLSITRASSLPKTFPFPAPHGAEQRPRPAYYYRQSSVIPYRLNKGRLEILVIASSGNKHCVVPKGIHDPGLSARESAATEALEEAGARGEVDAHSLGSYRQEKWGAVCEVEVYPMRVTELIPEARWEETHRGRQWLPADKAIRKLRQPALGPMIRDLSGRLQAD